MPSMNTTRLKTPRRIQRRTSPIYGGTALIYGALVAFGFFRPSQGEGFVSALDTSKLLVTAVLLGIAAAKMLRIATREEGTAPSRRDGLEVGSLMVLLATIVVQATGGTHSLLYPVLFLVLALMAAHTDLTSSLLLAGLAALLEGLPVFAAGALRDYAPLLLTHAAMLFSFASVVGAFLRLERQARIDAARRLSRFQGASEALAAETDDVEDLKEEKGLLAQERERRLRELQNELDASIHRAVSLARDTLSAHTVVYFRCDARNERLVVADALSEGDDLVETPLDPREGFFAGAIKNRQPIVLNDVKAMPVAYYRKEVGVRSVVVAPIVEGNWVTGLLVADHLEADRYGKAAAEILLGIGRLLRELENAGRERERREKLSDQHRHLLEVSKALQGKLRPEAIGLEALRSASKLAQIDCALVVFGAAEGERFTIGNASGIDEGRLLGKDAPTGETLVGWVLRNRVYLNAPGFQARTVKTPLIGARLDPAGVRAALIFPMLRPETGDALGACVFASMTRDAFTKDEFDLLENVSRQTAMSMSSAALFRRMEELATTDGLTGLHNHRYFQEAFTREIERAQRNPSTRFSLVLADIDHFKKVNDKYGHPTGDEVLRRVSKVLRATLQRKTDLIARYGGEEFVVVLADSDGASSAAVIDKVRAAIAREEFEHKGTTFRITMSAGIAAWPGDAGSPKPHDSATELKARLLDRADQALYRSKENGRNRTTLWSSIAPRPLPPTDSDPSIEVPVAPLGDAPRSLRPPVS